MATKDSTGYQIEVGKGHKTLSKAMPFIPKDLLDSNKMVTGCDSKQNLRQEFTLQAPSVFRTSQHDNGYTVNVLSGNKMEDEYTYYHKCNNDVMKSKTMSTRKVCFLLLYINYVRM